MGSRCCLGLSAGRQGLSAGRQCLCEHACRHADNEFTQSRIRPNQRHRSIEVPKKGERMGEGEGEVPSLRASVAGGAQLACVYCRRLNSLPPCSAGIDDDIVMTYSNIIHTSNIRTCTYTRPHSYIHAHTCAYMRVHVYTCTYVCNTHMHTHIHT